MAQWRANWFALRDEYRRLMADPDARGGLRLTVRTFVLGIACGVALGQILYHLLVWLFG